MLNIQIQLVEMLPNVPTLSDIDECKQVEICGQSVTCDNTDYNSYSLQMTMNVLLISAVRMEIA